MRKSTDRPKQGRLIRPKQIICWFPVNDPQKHGSEGREKILKNLFYFMTCEKVPKAMIESNNNKTIITKQGSDHKIY